MLLSIYTEDGSCGSFNIYGSRRLVFRYIRDPEIGPFNIYGRRKLVLSIYTVAGSWVFQYIRKTEVVVISKYTAAGSWVFQYIR